MYKWDIFCLDSFDSNGTPYVILYMPCILVVDDLQSNVIAVLNDGFNIYRSEFPDPLGNCPGRSH